MGQVELQPRLFVVRSQRSARPAVAVGLGRTPVVSRLEPRATATALTYGPHIGVRATGLRSIGATARLEAASAMHIGTSGDAWTGAGSDAESSAANGRSDGVAQGAKVPIIIADSVSRGEQRSRGGHASLYANGAQGRFIPAGRRRPAALLVASISDVAAAAVDSLEPRPRPRVAAPSRPRLRRAGRTRPTATAVRRFGSLVGVVRGSPHALSPPSSANGRANAADSRAVERHVLRLGLRPLLQLDGALA